MTEINTSGQEVGPDKLHDNVTIKLSAQINSDFKNLYKHLLVKYKEDTGSYRKQRKRDPNQDYEIMPIRPEQFTCIISLSDSEKSEYIRIIQSFMDEAVETFIDTQSPEKEKDLFYKYIAEKILKKLDENHLRRPPMQNFDSPYEQAEFIYNIKDILTNYFINLESFDKRKTNKALVEILKGNGHSEDLSDININQFSLPGHSDAYKVMEKILNNIHSYLDDNPYKHEILTNHLLKVYELHYDREIIHSPMETMNFIYKNYTEQEIQRIRRRERENGNKQLYKAIINFLSDLDDNHNSNLVELFKKKKSEFDSTKLKQKVGYGVFNIGTQTHQDEVKEGISYGEE